MWHKGAHALNPRQRRLHCKLLVTDALECKALNCYVPTALLCTQWGLLGEHHIHGVALAAHFGVTLAEPGVLLPDPMAVTGHRTLLPQARPGHGHIHERPPVGQHYLGLHPGPLRLVGAPSLGPAGAGTRAAPAPGQGWAPGGWASPWPQLWGSPGAEIHRLELVRRDHKHHVGMVGRSEVFLKI